MKTLSVKQPWADLLVSGLKDIENRTWATKYRGKLLIHASTRPDKGLFDNLTFDQLYSLPRTYISNCNLQYGSIIGMVELIDCVQNDKSVWAENGVYNWKLKNAIKFDKPITNVKGSLMFWDFPIENYLDA